MAEIDLGDLVRDEITGFVGFAVCREEWLYGEVRFAVQRREPRDDDGTPLNLEWFAAGRLRLAEASEPSAGF